MKYRSVNPYTGEEMATFDTITERMLEESLDQSWSAFEKWRKIPVRERIPLFLNLAETLLKNKEMYAETMTMEMGKPVSQAVAEVKKCAMACHYYSDNAERFLKPERISSPAGKSIIRYDPIGIVLAVMPWNFPFWQVIRCLVPALAAGNSLLLKHASNVPLSALNIEKAVAMSGFPDGIFMNLFIDHSQVEKLIASDKVRAVSLTGSNRAGEIIAMHAGASVKKSVLELGGSDPFIVFPDANLQKAVEAAVVGRFQNNGQSCIAAKRIFVHERIWSEFLHLFRLRVESLVIGDPMSPDVYMGPLVNEQAVAELNEQVQRTVAMGATFVTGGKAGVPGKCFYQPAIMIDVPYDSPVAVEETFGPVVPVFSFSGYDELVKHVNDSSFGLGSSVWTNNRSLMKRITGDLECGTVAINGFVRSDPALPFGGVKASGYGRELSSFGIREFVNVRTVTHYE